MGLNKIYVFCFYLCWVFFSGLLHAQSDSVSVTAEIDSYQAYENHPIPGLISITHDQKDKVDTNSFRMEDKPLAVDFVKQVKFSPNSSIVLSIYSFQLPAKPAGLYSLPEISVQVGGKKYQSIMSSYQIEAATPAAAVPSTTPTQAQTSVPQSSGKSQQAPSTVPAPSSPSSTQPVLRLEAGVDGKASLYPGQRTKLFYRYYFRGDIALTEEKLPLLDAEDLIKIGKVESKNYAEGDLSVNQISQEVEAVKPGKLSFGPSVVEGYAYLEDALGRRKYLAPKLTSEAPLVIVTVLPFPEKGKPASFNGAVGKYTFKASLSSSSTMDVGDEISLSLEIAGKGNLNSVPFPDIDCQPGFSGFFRLSDLPPEESIQGDTKTAKYKLTPLTAFIKEIPSVEFSFFDPEDSQYKILHSAPIPITVRPSIQPPVPNLDKATIPTENGVKKETKVYPPAPIEIEGIFLLRSSDLHPRIFGTWLSLAILPLGIAILAYQFILGSYLAAMRQKLKAKTSSELLDEAFMQPKGSPEYFELIGKSLKTALVESGSLSSVDIPSEDLPEKGPAGEVRQFLMDIEERRFSKGETMDFASIRKTVKALLQSIHKKSGEGP